MFCRRLTNLERSRSRVRFGVCCAGLLTIACNVIYWLPPLTPPVVEVPLLGGIVDTRPMFGKTADANGAELGEFLLATCGCGDWRVLIQDPDGRQQQCAIQFFTPGDYSAEGAITFYGHEDSLNVLGVVDQTTGVAAGDMDVDIFRRSFSAGRGESHTDQVDACILCHIGADPIYPQPPTHPEFIAGETNCLDCHDVVIE